MRQVRKSSSSGDDFPQFDVTREFHSKDSIFCHSKNTDHNDPDSEDAMPIESFLSSVDRYSEADGNWVALDETSTPSTPRSTRPSTPLTPPVFVPNDGPQSMIADLMTLVRSPVSRWTRPSPVRENGESSLGPSTSESRFDWTPHLSCYQPGVGPLSETDSESKKGRQNCWRSCVSCCWIRRDLVESVDRKYYGCNCWTLESGFEKEYVEYLYFADGRKAVRGIGIFFVIAGILVLCLAGLDSFGFIGCSEYRSWCYVIGGRVVVRVLWGLNCLFGSIPLFVMASTWFGGEAREVLSEKKNVKKKRCCSSWKFGRSLQWVIEGWVLWIGTTTLVLAAAYDYNVPLLIVSSVVDPLVYLPLLPFFVTEASAMLALSLLPVRLWVHHLFLFVAAALMILMTVGAAREIGSSSIEEGMLVGFGVLFSFVPLIPAVWRMKSSRTLFYQLRRLKKVGKMVELENQRQVRLLQNIFPTRIVKAIRRRDWIYQKVPEAVVVQIDIVAFTRFSTKSASQSVIATLNVLFGLFDRIAETFELEKIKVLLYHFY